MGAGAPSMCLAEIAELIRTQALSPLDHVTDALRRLDSDACNAIVVTDAEGALRAARALTDELASGRWRGPLHGIAVGVKDLIDVRGVPTRCGSNVMADAGPAPADSAIVAQLRAVGAVIVAKLHSHEFAYGPTGDVAAQGPCRNPHDLSRITGGSSSGSAAAVAAGQVPLALGTDTGCSVRVPAALCGVVGLKPSFGALPTAGVFPLSESMDHVGFITADARSAAIVWDVLAPAAAAVPAAPPATDLSGVVVGMPTDDHWQPVDPVIAASVTAVASVFEALGARLASVSTPGVGDLVNDYAAIVGAEAHATHADWLATRSHDYQPVTAERLRDAGTVDAGRYIAAQRSRRRIGAAIRESLASTDVLLVPTAPIRATPIGAAVVDNTAVRPALLSMCLPFNMMGLPAVSIPGPVADHGLPIGVQIVGTTLDERRLLSITAAVEERLGRPLTRVRS